MPKRVIIIDMIANYIVKKFLPAGIPEFHKIDDVSLLSIISWAQRWSMERTYDTAFEQVFPLNQLKESKEDFRHWFVADHPKLPMIVREELIRAFRIHMVSGRMDVLRLGAAMAVWARRGMWIGLGLSFLFLVF